MIKLIMARDEDGVVGNAGKLPWQIPDELAHFYLTIDGPNNKVLVGRKTYETLPKNRFEKGKIIVLTRQKIAGVTCITRGELFELFNQYRKSFVKNLFIAGGKALYEEFYTYAKELIISVVDGHYEGDTIVNLDLQGYRLVKVEPKKGFSVYYYERAFNED